MKTRTVVTTSMVGLLVAGAATPSLASAKAKPKPITGSYTATA